MQEFFAGLFTTGFLYGVITSLLAGLVAWGCKQIFFELKYKSKYSGIWKTNIYNEQGEVVKSDLLSFKHNGKTGLLKGTLSRVYPGKEVGKKWKVHGVLANNKLLLFTYSHNPIPSMASLCAILEEDNFFRGSYLRYNEREKFIQRVEIDLTKQSN